MARPKLGRGETVRLQLKISAEDLAAIDEWQFAERVASLSEAVRILCKNALDVDMAVEIERLKAENAKLREALEPFADVNASDEVGWIDGFGRERIWDWFCLSDFNRARATLADLTPGGR